MFFLDELPTQDMLDKYHDRYPEMQPTKLYNVLFFLRKASYVIRDLDSFFGEHGLSQTRFYILILLDREPVKDSITSIELSRKLNISKAVTSRTVNSLRECGYIIEKPHPLDTRSKILSLTDDGETKLHSVLPHYYALINKLDID